MTAPAESAGAANCVTAASMATAASMSVGGRGS
jgi:hypothetical protein